MHANIAPLIVSCIVVCFVVWMCVFVFARKYFIKSKLDKFHTFSMLMSIIFGIRCKTWWKLISFNCHSTSLNICFFFWWGTLRKFGSSWKMSTNQINPNISTSIKNMNKNKNKTKNKQSNRTKQKKTTTILVWMLSNFLLSLFFENYTFWSN